MRIRKDVIALDYSNVEKFFEGRSQKYEEDQPYVAVIYQDSNKELAAQKDRAEKEKIYPLLEMDAQSEVMDVACGIGRWADAIEPCIKRYVGVDLNEHFIHIARERVQKENFRFFTGSATELVSMNAEFGGGGYNRFIVTGLLMYLNEEDAETVLQAICDLSLDGAIVYLKEPMAIEDRLTLKDFYSEELQADYSAIYRAKADYDSLLEKTLIRNGFAVVKEDWAYQIDSLNNRRETAQYYYVLKKEAVADERD